MHLQTRPTAELLILLDGYIQNHNINSVCEIYRILHARNDLDTDFRKNAFVTKPDWAIRIVAEICQPLMADEIVLVESFDLYKELIETYGEA